MKNTCYLKINNEQVLIDWEDYGRLKEYTWHIQYRKDGSVGGVRTSTYDPVTKKTGVINMHQLILDHYGKHGADGIDHIDRNTLNNTKVNLRVCSNQQNQMNTNSRQLSSKYKGVSYEKKRKKWFVGIKINKRSKYVGRYDSEEEAGRAYDEEARKYHKEFGRYNFPKEGERSAL